MTYKLHFHLSNAGVTLKSGHGHRNCCGENERQMEEIIIMCSLKGIDLVHMLRLLNAKIAVTDLVGKGPGHSRAKGRTTAIITLHRLT